MALTRKDRFKLKSQIISAVESWSWNDTNLLLGEFNLDQLDNWNSNDSPSFADIITTLQGDAALVEMYALVMDIDINEVANVVEATEDTDAGWKPGYIRLFLTHSAMHKEFAGRVADELAVTGIHAFVAHDTMEYDQPWQEQIERALRSMDAFVALVHEEVNDSPWCQQEIGWALGRRVPRYVVRMGTDPKGFISREQWPSCAKQDPKEVADVISMWVQTLPGLGSRIVDGLLASLATVGNYMDAGATAERVAALGSLSDADFKRLDIIWHSNNQLHGGVLATRAMKPFYLANDRPWPPPKAASPPASAAVCETEEEPF
jgi:hypothetical protein